MFLTWKAYWPVKRSDLIVGISLLSLYAVLKKHYSVRSVLTLLTKSPRSPRGKITIQEAPIRGIFFFLLEEVDK